MSVGYCRRCKIVYKGFDSCQCGRKLNFDNEQNLDMYLEHGYILYTENIDDNGINNGIANERMYATIDNADILEKRKNRKSEKEKQREFILNSMSDCDVKSQSEVFDTSLFLKSLGLREKANET